MKILHLPNYYLPHVTGGKEVYVAGLVKYLSEQGIQNIIGIHQSDRISGDDYWHENIPVKVLPQVVDRSPFKNRFTREVDNLPGFEDLLINEKPDIVHFHEQSRGASLSHLRIVRKMGIKAVITFHTPGQICPQRALLRNGKVPCDGKLILNRCTRCQLKSLELREPLPSLISLLPNIKYKNYSSRLKKLTGYKGLTSAYFKSYYEFFDLADTIHVYSEWSFKTYERNLKNLNKIQYFRTGGTPSLNFNREKKLKPPLKIVFIGRCNEIKGIHVLIQAIKSLPESFKLAVHFFGPYWDDPYGEKMKKMIGDDNRFKAPVLIPNHQLHERLLEMDLAVIPSLWLETGPITVFDAFAVGLPVIGSNLGGIKELVRDNIDGMLFESGNANDLSIKIQRFYLEPDLYQNLRKNIKPNRTMKEVAEDTLILYNKILS